MTIFVDMDEVLADTYGAHIDIYNKEFNANLTLDDISSGEVWENVPYEHLQNVKDHVWRDGFFRELPLIKDSQEVMRELAAKHEVYIATAATQFPNSLREKSDWLDEHSPFITWEYRILCGHKFILDGDVLIDDRSYNLKYFNGRGLLFNSPHNRKDEGYERVANWQEVANKLLD